MNAEFGELASARLVLSPLREADAGELLKTVDERTFDFYVTLQPRSLAVDDFEGFIRAILAVPNHRAYTMRLRESGEVVGCSSLMDIRAPQRGLEIGLTWIAPNWRGTFVNPEAKRMMLEYAFETLKMVRVQLKCDARNAHSSAAIAKLGAQFEGRLRKHGIQPNGFIRDTLMYSITDDEWPEVRSRLNSRLLGLN